MRRVLLKILISGGGTIEPIDDVRFIANMSSGKTAAGIAESLASAGHEVTLLHGKNAHKPVNINITTSEFDTFEDLDTKIQDQLKKQYDVIVHSAAVSDYSIDHIKVEGEESKKLNKLPSDKELTLKLKPNFKIINRIKSYATNNPLLIGFKLTSKADVLKQKIAITKVIENGADLVIHNDLAMIDGEKHQFGIYNKNLECLGQGESKTELGQQIVSIIERYQ